MHEVGLMEAPAVAMNASKPSALSVSNYDGMRTKESATTPDAISA